MKKRKALKRDRVNRAFESIFDKIHNVLLDFLRMKQKDDAERQSLYRRLGEWHLARKAYTPAKRTAKKAILP